MSLVEREAAALFQTYRRLPVSFVRGEGVWLWDDRGRRYIDCLAGIAVVSVGHSNPVISGAVAKQMAELVHVSNLFYTEPQVVLAERLKELSGLDRVFFCNDGATANEAAIKLARRWGQKQRGPECYEVVSLLDSFHGRTLATLAATGQPDKQAVFQPLPPGFHQVAPGDIEALAAAVGPRTAAVMLETTQGEGGVVPLSDEYLQAVRRLCDEREVLLIVDDVQAGMGRSGEWFSWQGCGITADVTTLAKALANGLPIGACLSTERAAAFEFGDHATTFGGGPVVSSAAMAVLDEIEFGGLLANCRARGAQLTEALNRLDGVTAVRGRGLLLGAVLAAPVAAQVASAALAEGLLINNVRPDVVRFTPPLTIDADEVDEAVERFERALAAAL